MSPQREAKPYFIEQILHYYYILNTYLHIGMRRLVKASSKGQNLFPNTVAYCGNKREIENLYLEEIIKKITKDYKEVIFIDIHTGTAKRGRLNIFTQDVNFRKKLKKISRYVYIKKIKSKRGMNYIGGNDKLFLENTNGLKNAEMTLEFGPFSRINSLFSIEHTSFLISYENMITFFGPKEKLEKARIRLKNVFSPERKTYKKFVIQKSSNFFKNLFRNF